MTIDQLPPSPLPTDTKASFDSKAFALAAALGGFVTQANALAVAADADAVSAATSAGVATTKAGEASASASSAAASAGAASTGASNASTSASNAANSASAASTSASNASSSASSAASNAAAVASALAVISGGPVVSINGLTGVVTLTAAGVGAEPADATILRSAGIGVLVQAYSAALTAWSGKTAPAGTPLGTSDNQTLTNKTLSTGCLWNGGTIAVQYGGTGATTLSGLLKGNGTSAFTAATAGTDYLAPGGALGTPSSGNLSNCTVDGTNAVGYRNIPQNSQSAAYTLVSGDAGKHILHPSADTTARTFTIPANASVAYPIGTALTFVNQNAAGVVTIAITADTMRLAGQGATGSRTLAANGVATAIKLTSTEWIISGTGLT